ncbi:hypothetical protein GJAV_G00034330 [Gymnothorax javanicus]|nr:hypothetical protein GJAV_G00034330 [Gymnothorax javanicus]
MAFIQILPVKTPEHSPGIPQSHLTCCIFTYLLLYQHRGGNFYEDIFKGESLGGRYICFCHAYLCLVRIAQGLKVKAETRELRAVIVLCVRSKII